jgi:putative FmdB family regulatory protein
MPMYEYQCPAGHGMTAVRKIDERNDPMTCGCGKVMERAISLPTIHTINTHLRGTNIGDGMGYFDSNLRDRRTGKVPYVTDLGTKRKLLKERGLFEYGNELPAAKQRQETERLNKRVSISGSSK